ncbi:PTS lactose transporter subunit IIC [Desulfosporosinus sp. HMP52]|uniref:EAL domain-containing protein n=1 Tax=Desulfosporosinus sp. HMP52 TaxID=1487923 RepID=UPI00051FC558|nr:EAL domain-containing protein [Desulfosporosinus sp. HMP52]KGK86281.1 PTS lactose transporter subunit IIC [Desulfosporosinus sp. HMP52]
MKFTQRALNISTAISENLIVKSINKGLILIIPLIIAGSVALVINNFPLVQYQDLMTSLFGPDWKTFGQSVWNLTFGLMGLALSVTISYSLAVADPQMSKDKVNPIITSLVALISLLTIINTGSSGIHTSNAGVTGIFLSIIVTVLSTELFIHLNRCLDKYYLSFMVDADPVIPKVLFLIFPFCLTLVGVSLLRVLLTYLGIEDINQLITDLTMNIFLNIENQFAASILFVFLNQVFWFFGIHGNNILYSVSQDIYFKAIDLNISALSTGGEPVHILTKPFLDVFVLIGGSGSTLCLLIAIFLAGKNSSTLKLAKIAFLTSIFNINEIIVFGLPVVLNPLFLIPYILVPLILTIIAYLTTYIGLVPVTIAPVDWTTPPLLGGWLATSSWRGMALQILNIIIGTCLYYPFVRLYELQKRKAIINNYEQLVQTVLSEDYSTKKRILTRSDQIGNTANALSYDIQVALEKREFFLEYQPQVDEKGEVIGVEALLRWNHFLYGKVNPQVVVAIAEEAGIINKLGRWVIEAACFQLGEWNKQGIVDIRMAINISPTQLNDQLLDILVNIFRITQLNPRDIELEITETVAFGTNTQTVDLLEKIKGLGVSIAMDDFGAGHASLYYMKYFNLDKIKIDGSITKDVIDNKSCQDIISSITYLAESMEITVLAEYVETLEQAEVLKKLRCQQFQGYYFSRPLSVSQCVKVIGNCRQEIEGDNGIFNKD